MRQNFQYERISDGNIEKLNVSPHPDWDEFGHFIDIFLNNEGASLIVQDVGMDRHQVRYRKGGQHYILQFEHYTDSIWIERDFQTNV